ncbi:hypothetical protein BDZ90DRAFT_220834 [Jaminaea rosea]|uniref:Uncharacterized protein n=1 Tax=Jaminaea rosea TaxID=1569628 RepID=A0A316UR55_9BASI|nr:hypothetical protein BDZ90DRAFT_220834 [Jaminaea rosea]PWN27268.1 hypothetical protein BDZ90DRAFT_220834 [Jaminaea rosea]
MARSIFTFASTRRFFSDREDVWNGVALRLAKGDYAVCPPTDPRLDDWTAAIAVLNCEAAITITSTVVAGVLHFLPVDVTEVALSPTERVQVVQSTADLVKARKAQGAAFIQGEDRLVVWADKVADLAAKAEAIDVKMVQYIWLLATGKSINLPSMAPRINCASPSERTSVYAPPLEEAKNHRQSGSVDEKDDFADDDLEASAAPAERKTLLLAPIIHGLGAALNLVLQGNLIRILLLESGQDHQWMRLALAAIVPAILAISLFFTENIIGGLFQIFGPIKQMSANTRYYSGKAPKRIKSGPLPHITIQMPVYKESLEEVLIPTIESLNVAISTYELQGGTASILVSEDGLLVVSEEEREKRLDYYERQQIAWVARPGHNVDGYVRKGRFKKASNLNFTCLISLHVEELMDERRPQFGQDEIWTDEDESRLYDECFAIALAAAHPLAKGAGNVRIGELILMIDCDTRVPRDCFLDAASEMAQSPDVAILQHCSGVMEVTKDNYFEAGIAFFTRTVNFAISFVVSNGDLAPFMGHNAFLRWSALQEAAEVDPDDGVRKIWAETTVSEDFEITLRLLMKKYIIRWATYSDCEFKEGVSLTCDDELNRWQKYAFGVSELVFRPLKYWWKGPITPIYRRFLWAKGIPWHSKFCSTSYIFSYYAIACAMPLTIALTLIQGWFAPTLDLVFLQPFKVFVAIVVVFNGLCMFGFVAAKFRSRRQKLWPAIREHVVWMPFMTIFFTGLSYHVLTAVLSHPVGYNMTWGSTNKSLEQSNFFVEVPAIFRRYWKMIIACVLTIIGFAVLNSPEIVPLEWQLIGGATLLWCPMWLAGMHLVYHVALNPQLLRFSF